MPTDSYPLSDLLYRSVALTDDAGDITEVYDTDAYGNTIAYSAAGTGSDWWADDATTTDEPACEFIFTGRRRDPESEIYFYRARYYSPELGRFTSRDPIGYSSRSINQYTYSDSKPTLLTDPSGLESIRLAGSAAGGVKQLLPKAISISGSCGNLTISRINLDADPASGRNSGQPYDHDPSTRPIFVGVDIRTSFTLIESPSCCCYGVRWEQTESENSAPWNPDSPTNAPGVYPEFGAYPVNPNFTDYPGMGMKWSWLGGTPPSFSFRFTTKAYCDSGPDEGRQLATFSWSVEWNELSEMLHFNFRGGAH